MWAQPWGKNWKGTCFRLCYWQRMNSCWGKVWVVYKKAVEWASGDCWLLPDRGQISVCSKSHDLVSVLHCQFFPLTLPPKGTMYWKRDAHFHFYLSWNQSHHCQLQLYILPEHWDCLAQLLSLTSKWTLPLSSGCLRVSFPVLFTPSHYQKYNPHEHIKLTIIL